MANYYLKVFLLLLFILPYFTGCSSPGEITVKIVDCPTELPPVYCVLGKKIFNDTGLFDMEIRNSSSQEATITASVEVSDLSSPEIQTLELKPGEAKVLSFLPVFNQKVLEFTEQRLSSVNFKVEENDKIIHEETKEITILAPDDIIWGVDNDFDTSFLIASWVTPRDPVIGNIVSKAKEYMEDRSLCGYQRESEEELIQEMDAVWKTLYDEGISYVSSSTSFGGELAQRIRFPRESIKEKSANCADGTVLLASIFENIEMEPLIIITTDHVFLGLRGLDDETVYYIETTMVADSTLEEAMKAGDEAMAGLKKLKEGKDYIIVDIVKEREDGITPFPLK